MVETSLPEPPIFIKTIFNYLIRVQNFYGNFYIKPYSNTRGPWTLAQTQKYLILRVRSMFIPAIDGEVPNDLFNKVKLTRMLVC